MLLHLALFAFLDSIHEHNSRKYFASIRPLYDDIRQHLQDFFNLLISDLSIEDTSLRDVQAKQCLFRIYRDARRLKPGDPIYKNNRAAHITATGKKTTNAGYYIHFQSGNSFFGGGIYRPTSQQLKNIRDFLTLHGDRYRQIVSDPRFIERFGTVEGSSLTRMPRGYDTDHPSADLIIKKQHLIMRQYTDEEVLTPGFYDILRADCALARPRFSLLNEASVYDITV